MIYGVILAGGRSSRFGREKAAAEIDGQAMLARIAGVLTPHVRALAVNAPPDRWAAHFALEHGLVLLPDAPGDPNGPLSGVKAGLAWASDGGANLLVTAPCDTPFLPDGLVSRLVDALTLGAGAAVARTVSGLQPLCAVWRCESLDVVRTALAQGEHPAIRAVLGSVDAVEVAFEDAAAFDNINTPEDYARVGG